MRKLRPQIMSEYKALRFSPKERTRFFADLNKRVRQYFKDNEISPYANAAMVTKTVVFLGLYLIPFAFVLTLMPGVWMSILLYSIMGFAIAGIGMTVMHDANHGAYSKSKTVNKWLGYTLNLAGGSVSNWKLQHNLLHHTYTNVTDYDEDIAGKALLRFSPHSPLKKVHKFQWIYAYVLYGFLTMYWSTAKDFQQFVRYSKTKVNKEDEKRKRSTIIRILLIKMVYFFTFLVLPPLLGYSIGMTILGFFIMHFIAGFLLSIIFQLAHTVEGTNFPLPSEDTGNIENDWAIHQLNTTMNFSPNSKFLTWYLGGLNYQVEHHLFPDICHVHYPNLSKVVSETCKEYGIPYLMHPSFSDAVKSHVLLLKELGRVEPPKVQSIPVS